MSDGFQSFGQSSIRLSDRQPKCSMGVNPNFAKKYDPEGGDFLKQTRPNLGLPGRPYLCRRVSRMVMISKRKRIFREDEKYPKMAVKADLEKEKWEIIRN